MSFAPRSVFPVLAGFLIGLAGGALGALLLTPAPRGDSPVTDPPIVVPDVPQKPSPAADASDGEILKLRDAEIQDLRARLEVLNREPASPPVPDPKPEVDALEPPADGDTELRQVLGREPTDEERTAYEAGRSAWLANFAKKALEHEAGVSAFANGDIMGALRNLRRITPEVREAVSNAEAFQKHFERKIRGPEVPGAEAGDADLEDGTILRFGAGVQKWHVSEMGVNRKPFPKDLLIVGAGRDHTLLQIDEFNSNVEIRSLTFQDLTLDCANNYLTDLRTENPITIRFERCRVVRFDMGAGASVMLSARNAAFYATDTLFECGYGRTAWSGTVFQCDKLLGRLERCTISWPGSGLGYPGAASFVCFVECKFIQVPDLLEAPGEDHFWAAHATFTNCTFSGDPELLPINYEQRKLTDINPDWIVK